MVPTRNFVMIAVVCCLLAGGCGKDASDRLAKKMDSIAETVETVAPSAQQTLDSPVGQLVPEKAHDPITVGIAIASAVAAAWLAHRNSKVRVAMEDANSQAGTSYREKVSVQETLRSVVNAVDAAAPDVQADLKASVKANMLESGEYAKQKQIVTNAKG